MKSQERQFCVKDAEQWRPAVIDGKVMEGYEVSDLGRVRSTRQLLKGTKLPNGYMHVSLGKGHNNYIHRLVAFAFPERCGGSFKPGMEINHRNFRRDDNWPENLEWVTTKQNRRHSAEADRLPGTHLSDKEALAVIRNLYDEGTGFSCSQVAIKFGVCRDTIRALLYDDRRPEIRERFCEQRGINLSQFYFRVSGEERAFKVFDLHDRGLKDRQVAEEVGLSVVQVRRIRTGRARPHLRKAWQRQKETAT